MNIPSDRGSGDFRGPVVVQPRSLALLLLAAAGCAGGDAVEQASASGREIQRWRLSDAPAVRIGVVSGDPNHQLFQALSSLRLADGRIAVADAGASEVRFFDERGRYLSTSGRRGDGPGEFRRPSRIRFHAPDTLLVWDQQLWRTTFLGLDGSLIRTEPFFTAKEKEKRLEEDFPLDDWIYGRNLVVSPAPAGGRRAIRGAIHRMPPVRPPVALRYLKLSREGHIWAADAIPPHEEEMEWRVYDGKGALLARLTLPARFEPHDIGPDYVLGGYRDELEIDFIRLYDLVRPSEGVAGSAGILAVSYEGGDDMAEAEGVLRPPALSDEVYERVIPHLKTLYALQAGHRDEHGVYARDIGVLDFEMPKGVEIRFTQVSPYGWTLLFDDLGTGGFCVTSFGAAVPMGWSEWRITCPGRAEPEPKEEGKGRGKAASGSTASGKGGGKGP